MKFYTKDRLGPRRTLTPEGFLVCHDAPIARTGEQIYLASEFPGVESRSGQVVALRDEDQVFRPETMMSFEGKPLVNDHPKSGENVDPTNWRRLAIGHVQNVRRGVGDQSDLLVGDLVVTDADAIRDIQAGKRELSAGYEMDLRPIAPGRVRMVDIVGNHVALVGQGRCGARCSIGDSRMTLSLRDRIRRAFFGRDQSELEDVLKDVPADPASGADPKTDGNGDGRRDPLDDTHIHIHMPGESGEDGPIVGDPTEGDDPMHDDPTGAEGLMERLDRLESAVAALVATKGGGEEPNEGDPSEGDQGGRSNMGPEDENYDEDGAEGDPPSEGGEKDEPDGRARDSASLQKLFDDTVSRAEILSPGIRLPVFDSAVAPKITRDRICALRRRSVLAVADGAAKEVIDELAGGRPVRSMACDALGILFVAASRRVRDSNNRHVVSRAVAHDGKIVGENKGPPTNAEMNKRNAEFWAARKNVFANRG
jgi:hypothetical protein